MKNRKSLLIIFALSLAVLTSACSSAGNSAPEENSDSGKKPQVISGTDETSKKPETSSPDTSDSETAPVEPRITYSSGSPDTNSGRYSYEKAYADDYTADSYSFAAEGEVRSRSASKGAISAATTPSAGTGTTDAAMTPPADPGTAVSPERPVSDDGVKKEAPTADEPIADDPTIDEPIVDDPTVVVPPDHIPEKQPEVGLLTASVWNDNDNWGFFTNLVNSGKIAFPSYGIDPRYRTKAEIKGADGKVLVNAQVQLLDGDRVIWSAVTDKAGNAYLFAENAGQGTEIVVTSGGKTQSFSLETDGRVQITETSDPQAQQGKALSGDASISLTFDGEGALYKATDIMFIVDATGSMFDEMIFLQKEFTAITEDVGDDDTRYAVSFYRDEGDDYITKCYDFTRNITELQKQLNSETATGGGDMPEAVDKVLDESILKSNWSKESVKLAFMIFDAPPHDGTEQSILSLIKAAAEKGIRLIPVVSSNSERNTELFGRACAITTGGTYVFLTDDSGIGDSHLEPIIGEHKTEKLYDIIVRIIGEYKQG